MSEPEHEDRAADESGLDDGERAALQADRDHDREQDEADNDAPSGADEAFSDDLSS